MILNILNHFLIKKLLFFLILRDIGLRRNEKNFEKSLHFGAVGCATDQSLCSTYSINKFPELKFFDNAALQSTYSGPFHTGIKISF